MPLLPARRGRVSPPIKTQRARSSSSDRTRRASNQSRSRGSLNDIKISLIAADMIISHIMTHINIDGINPHTGRKGLESSSSNHIKSLSKMRDCRGKGECRAERDQRLRLSSTDSSVSKPPRFSVSKQNNLQAQSKGQEERRQLRRLTSSSDSRTTSLSSDSPASTKPPRTSISTRTQNKLPDKQTTVDPKTSKMRRMNEPTRKASKERHTPTSIIKEGRKVNAPIKHHFSPSNEDRSKRVSHMSAIGRYTGEVNSQVITHSQRCIGTKTDNMMNRRRMTVRYFGC